MRYNLVAIAAQFIHNASAREFWLLAAPLGIASVVSCALGFRALQRTRMMTDMPTSRLRSAAQGYVELEGRARMMPGEAVYAPLSRQPCTWYRYTVEHRGSEPGKESLLSAWRTVDEGVSEAIFFLDDGTGCCIVDPDGATVTASARSRWHGQSEWPGLPPFENDFWSRLLSFGPYRYTEYRIHDHDPLYAVGQFSSLGDIAASSLSEDMRDILSDWKRDRQALLKRFDANRDGLIDQEEWELARAAAEKEAQARRGDRPPQPEFNILAKPPHGKPYVLSAISQQALISRYRYGAILGIAMFLVLGTAATWAVNLRLG